MNVPVNSLARPIAKKPHRRKSRFSFSESFSDVSRTTSSFSRSARTVGGATDWWGFIDFHYRYRKARASPPWWDRQRRPVDAGRIGQTRPVVDARCRNGSRFPWRHWETHVREPRKFRDFATAFPHARSRRDLFLIAHARSANVIVLFRHDIKSAEKSANASFFRRNSICPK